MKENSIDYKLQIEKMRDNFESDRPNKLKLHRPWWMFADEELSKIYEEKVNLIKSGNVYYAHLLQANTKLFKPFPPFDYPAQIVYSTVSAIDENPLLLRDSIEEIYSYKYSDENPPTEWSEIVENIRNEKDRTAFSIECLSGFAKITAKMQTIMVYRKHLPTRILQGSILPVIACPDICDSVLILPKEYWTDEFTAYWLACSQ